MKKEATGKAETKRRENKTKKNTVPFARACNAPNLREKSCDNDKHLLLAISRPHSSRATRDESGPKLLTAATLNVTNPVPNY